MILLGLVGDPTPTNKEFLMQENHRIIDLLNQAIQAEMPNLQARNVYDMKDESLSFFKPIQSRLSRMEDWIERSTHMYNLKIMHLENQHHWNSTTSMCKNCQWGNVCCTTVVDEALRNGWDHNQL
ncbi:hypothetical protein ACFE04_009797 [Oxalis oulophora]